MPIQGEYMGMMLTIDDVDKENREFFRHCAEGTFHLQKGKESGLLRYPPTTACRGRVIASTSGFRLKVRAPCIPMGKCIIPFSQHSERRSLI